VGGWLDVSSRLDNTSGAGTSIILSVPIADQVPDPTKESFQ
jgi:hypothetical protein